MRVGPARPLKAGGSVGRPAGLGEARDAGCCHLPSPALHQLLPGWKTLSQGGFLGNRVILSCGCRGFAPSAAVLPDGPLLRYSPLVPDSGNRKIHVEVNKLQRGREGLGGAGRFWGHRRVMGLLLPRSGSLWVPAGPEVPCKNAASLPSLPPCK